MILQASIQEIISLGKYLDDFSKPNSLLRISFLQQQSQSEIQARVHIEWDHM